MSRAFFRQRLWLRFLAEKTKPSGFTLLELLVAMIIGAMISAGLLFLVIQLIQANSREAARSDTQRDLQAAIDYIARDVREAVYVYDGNCLLDRPTGSTLKCPGLKSYLPANISEKSDNVPVLAFWRVDPLPKDLRDRCKSNADFFSSSNLKDVPAAIQGVPCLSGRMYTLVVYSLSSEKTEGALGRARIRRYDLPQFTSQSTAGGATTAPTLNPGWVDPSRKETDFSVWPLDNSTLEATSPTSLQASRPPNTTSNFVLTDFVDQSGLYDGTGNRAQPPLLTGYELTPRRGSSISSEPLRGFYVYVKGTENRGALNQEVVIRIQGDAAGRPGIAIGNLSRSVIPLSLEMRVLTRGVTSKTE